MFVFLAHETSKRNLKNTMKLENIYSYPLFSYFYFFLNFLQYCVGFCCKTIWIHHNYPYSPSLWSLPTHPSRLTQSPKLDSPCYRAASYQPSFFHFCPSLDNYKESLSTISIFVFFLLYISPLQIQHKYVTHTIESLGWVQVWESSPVFPKKATNSSIP